VVALPNRKSGCHFSWQRSGAWQAHLGGFFAGFLLVPLLEKRSN
jgi:membrane associated rhomboid family serine protease